MPALNATWSRLVGPVEVEDVGVVEHGRVAVRGAEQAEHGSAARDRDAVDLDVRARDSAGELDRAFEPEQLLDRLRPQLGVGGQPGSRLLVRPRTATPLPSRLTVVSNPAPSSSNAVARSSRSVSRSSGSALTSWLRMSSPGLRRRLAKCSSNQWFIAFRLRLTVTYSRWRQADVEHRRSGVAPGQELLVHVRRYAEDLGDHRDGQQVGVLGDDVDLALAGQRVEQFDGTLLDPVRDLLQCARRERLAHQAAVAGVGRRVDRKQ